MRVELGGPGVGCSAMRVRRLLAGELAGAEAERVARHVSECGRCQAVQEQVALEKAELARAVPFEAFAAGVAEKLALTPAGAGLLPGPLLRWAAPLAAAAVVALVGGALLVRAPAKEDPGLRSKGGAFAQLFIEDASGADAKGPRGVRELGLAEPVAPGARLQIVLHPSGRRYAAAVLLEPAESSVLYNGPAVQGALPQSFEWTGGEQATLLVVLSDAPVNAVRIHARADAPAGADVVQISLHR